MAKEFTINGLWWDLSVKIAPKRRERESLQEKIYLENIVRERIDMERVERCKQAAMFGLGSFF